ncbi:MAG: hypothetical protein LBQ21_07415 [Clostridiales Family XIII bacterium]|jgi:hypothetical protein|nr:hypothetical protein [Clostridiales Family XIII bacterium]
MINLTANFVARLRKAEKDIANGVVETGTSGAWTYKKYADKTCEAYQLQDLGSVALPTQYGSIYVSAAITAPTPPTDIMETRLGFSAEVFFAGGGGSWKMSWSGSSYLIASTASGTRTGVKVWVVWRGTYT